MAAPNPFDLRHHRPGPDGDLVEQFLSTFGSRLTRRNYRTDLRQFLDGEEVTRQQVSHVGEEDIVEFLRGKADSLKRSTLKRKLETIRSFFRWLVRQDVLGEGPIQKEVETGDLIDQVVGENQKTAGGDRGDEKESRSEEGASGQSVSGPSLATHRSGREEDPFASETDSDGGSARDNRSDSSSSGRLYRSGTPVSSQPTESHSSTSDGDAGQEDRFEEGGYEETEAEAESPPEDEPTRGRSTDEGASGGGASDPTPVNTPPTDTPSPDTTSVEKRSGGEDSTGPPQWAYEPGEPLTVDLRRGEHFSIADLPKALRGALRKISSPDGANGFVIRCTRDLKILVQSHQDQESLTVQVRVKHRALRRAIRNQGDLSDEPGLRRAVGYLAGRDWVLPRAIHASMSADSGEAEGPFSEEGPIWSQESADNQMIRVYIATEVTGVLTEGFNLEKDERVFLGA